jgi:PP-loop superfamily ATP-utilizing enzyme
MPDSETRYLLKSINRAVRDFDLISAGDRIAVGVSGGKDSRTLLDMLQRGVDIPGSYDFASTFGAPSARQRRRNA